MREPVFRRLVQGVAVAAVMAFTSASMPRVVAAQGTPDQGMNQPMTNDDDGGDWGWIGLLGLVGLLGLRRRDTDRHIDTTTRRP